MSSTTSSTPRRKMGPPQRRQFNNDPSQIVGRVAVYCVAAGLDLQGLRAHVFRRGFSGARSIDTSVSVPEADDNLANMLLTRTVKSEADIEEEVLHVSNSPYRGNDGFLNTVNAEDEDAEADRRTLQILLAAQDIFYFDYGCVVFWGLTPQEEKAALTELAPFTINNVSAVELSDSYDSLEYSYDKKTNPQRPIRFDRMKLRTLNVEEKLSLSYGLAQSSKLFVLESRVLESIEATRYLPQELSIDGKIKSSKKEINRLIGKLFVEQTEVNLFSSILDTPDFLWDNDEYLPAYEYMRSYLEVDKRVDKVNSRISVISELLDVLNAQVAHNNSERLEWIIIWLISVEIVLGIYSNPLFAGRRVVASLLVPSAVLLFKKLNWSGFT